MVSAGGNVRKRTLILLLAGVSLLSSCGAVRYGWQAARGQLALLRNAQPISEVLKRPDTPAEVRRKLELVQRVRQFAVGELGLPDHGAFQSYIDLHRPYVVWNVFSAPEFSTTLKTQCFPITGCVSYQGFFSEKDAQQEGEHRRTAGDDVLVAGITAYSTLGYLKDPVLSSMFTNSDAWLVRTIIHELSHPSLYVPGDTVFNESFATAIENEGMRRWLNNYGSPALAEQDKLERQRAEQWRTLSLAAREQLNTLYRQAMPDSQKRQQKAAILDDLQARGTTLRREWFGPQASPAARQSNASLGAVATYAELVPDFERLLARVNGDIPTFIQEAKKCAAQSRANRAACLRGQ